MKDSSMLRYRQQPGLVPLSEMVRDRAPISDEEALAFWSKQYGRPISKQELFEIRSNIREFFRLLAKIKTKEPKML